MHCSCVIPRILSLPIVFWSCFVHTKAEKQDGSGGKSWERNCVSSPSEIGFSPPFARMGGSYVFVSGRVTRGPHQPHKDIRISFFFRERISTFPRVDVDEQ